MFTEQTSESRKAGAFHSVSKAGPADALALAPDWPSPGQPEPAAAQVLNGASLRASHISTHIIYAVLTEKALNPFVECASGLLSGEGLSITLKFGRKRSIEHNQSLSELPSLAKKTY